MDHIGDSPALRSHGAQLRDAAERVDTLATRLDRRVEGSSDYVGPAAERFRASMSERIQRLHAVARDIQDLADVIGQDSSSDRM
jgi:hypothetical protein